MEKSNSFLQQTFNLNSPSYCSQCLANTIACILERLWMHLLSLQLYRWITHTHTHVQIGSIGSILKMCLAQPQTIQNPDGFPAFGVSLPQTAPLCHSRFLFLLASRTWTLTWTSPQFSSIELDVAFFCNFQCRFRSWEGCRWLRWLRLKGHWNHISLSCMLKWWCDQKRFMLHKYQNTFRFAEQFVSILSWPGTNMMTMMTLCSMDMSQSPNTVVIC